MKKHIKSAAGSFMNTTKWKHLLNIIDTLPFPPAFVVKYVKENMNEARHLESLNTENVSYYGDWNLNTGPGSLPPLEAFNTIEYIIIRPAFSRHTGKNSKDEIQDISEEVLRKLSEANIPFETAAFGNIYIYGYK